MILDVAIRTENLLQQLSAQLVCHNSVYNCSLTQWRQAQSSHRSSENAASVTSPQVAISPGTVSNANRAAGSPDHVSNAIISPLHASTTESILSWPHFAEFRNLIKESKFSVFHLENKRYPFMPQSPMSQPYCTKREVERVIRCFERGINFWYPTMTRSKTRELEAHIIHGNFQETTESCLALLIMALGCASALVQSVATKEIHDGNIEEFQNEQRILGTLFFDCAFKRISLVQAEFTAEAVQCLFFAGYDSRYKICTNLLQSSSSNAQQRLYFSFLQRPLQAWSFISAAATKCRLLLSYEVEEQNPAQAECLRRVFWSCYILESDFLAELSALPQTGIAEIESSIPLPSEYCTQESQADQEQSSLYFLACISMRRLLNRVHDLLYARDAGVGFDNQQFPSVVSELGYQLEEWKDLLPFKFQFVVNLEPTRSTEGAFLRQRYLTCKSVIYRPYLTWALSNKAGLEQCSPIVYEGSRLCLEACWMHAQNLRSLPHTIMVDTWICSLSMASVILITLAASRVPALGHLISRDILDIGPHVHDLLTRWMNIPGGDVSPSVLESTKLIANVSTLLKLSWHERGIGE
ncbi:hypothetical protein N7532_000195 [Penicillium argentinense]|uniref:Xylanolytic transcriptional activator regulatory domain-containing protein n=1 Tax=Penicillium argentinense TaxID=1131581 RepID=A0A9W9G4S8_9EURO|nr:uncharacterized protein N7532_000195 [Penicillium argentinense]KAJ5112150.1 hypothetical protein N7532_000195 [Penicillium argentinense]